MQSIIVIDNSYRSLMLSRFEFVRLLSLYLKSYFLSIFHFMLSLSLSTTTTTTQQQQFNNTTHVTARNNFNQYLVTDFTAAGVPAIYPPSAMQYQPFYQYYSVPMVSIR